MQLSRGDLKADKSACVAFEERDDGEKNFNCTVDNIELSICASRSRYRVKYVNYADEFIILINSKKTRNL